MISKNKSRYYRGKSMTGAFHLGDRLVIHPVLRKEIKRGDVIVFRSANLDADADDVVHRVVNVIGDSFITRGDNNPCCDPGPVRFEQVIGKVKAVRREKETIMVDGGFKGLIIARSYWEFSRFYRCVRKFVGYPYQLLRLSGIAPRLWKPEINQVQVQTKHGILIKYLYKNQKVGTWDKAHQVFECRKPFDLVIPSPLDEGLPS